MRVYVISVWIMGMAVALAVSTPRSTRMKNSKDRYCADTIFKQTRSRSSLDCAVQCLSDDQCVACSQRASVCVLHDGICSSDLLAEQGAVYIANREDQWECFGFSCYYMPTLKARRTKAEADAVCEALGAHVLAIETAEENDLVNNLVFHSSYDPVEGSDGQAVMWLHLIDGTTWGHSGDTASYGNWIGRRPEAGECSIQGFAGKWGPRLCTTEYTFVCEK